MHLHAMQSDGKMVAKSVTKPWAWARRASQERPAQAMQAACVSNKLRKKFAHVQSHSLAAQGASTTPLVLCSSAPADSPAKTPAHARNASTLSIIERTDSAQELDLALYLAEDLHDVDALGSLEEPTLSGHGSVPSTSPSFHQVSQYRLTTLSTHVTSATQRACSGGHRDSEMTRRVASLCSAAAIAAQLYRVPA